jgi:hypothetical protein
MILQAVLKSVLLPQRLLTHASLPVCQVNTLQQVQAGR